VTAVLVVIVALALTGMAVQTARWDRRPAAQPTRAAGPSGAEQRTRSQAGALADWFGPVFALRSGGSFGVDRTRRLPAGDTAPVPVLEVDYPAGSASNRAAALDDSALGGAQVYLDLRDGPVDALHLRYCVRFPVGFDFVKGGKLPGLFGGWVTSGQHIPDGRDGWSTRYMWRAGGAGEVYAYLPTSIAHGTSLGRGSWHFTPGAWNCLEQAVVLNQPGRADGSVTVWLDGHEVYVARGVRFRDTTSLRIDGLFFSTFFGGGDSTWASPYDQSAQFAAFAVSARYIGPPAWAKGG
jgi:hypothetical protein